MVIEDDRSTQELILGIMFNDSSLTVRYNTMIYLSLEEAGFGFVILDKDDFTLDELLEEEEIIQECKALNSRLINFLREKTQVEQLLRYVVEEPHEDSDSSRTFKFPFVACEVFTCEIDVILRTLVEDEELMDLLFSFLDPNRLHSPLLAGYFNKVVVCLMLRKTVSLMNYVQGHQNVLRQLVDLIGITSIMEVLVRLVGADDHAYPSYLDIMQWLSDSNLLEMIVDKLSPSSPHGDQANAAETLCAITRNTGSSLAIKLSSPRIFGHALEDSHSTSGLVNSLSVCISLLDPRRSVSSLIYSVRGQHMYEAPMIVNTDTVNAMVPKLGDLVMLLNVSTDEKVVPTPYGELRPPLGKHRLKIVEFISVYLKAGNASAEEELVTSGTIKRVIELFFEYPYNNALHHHVESIMLSCMESKNDSIVYHIFKECDLINKILKADRQPLLSDDPVQPTVPAPGKQPPRNGNLGHITRIANKILQLGENNGHIQTHLQENGEWNEWQATVLQERNVVWNVYRWGCGRPTTLHDRTRDSDDDILHDRDYDVAALANNLSQAFRPDLFVTEGSEEDNGAIDRDDEDVYFNDDSAEVVISSLRLGDDQGSLFTNSNWFTFRDERIDNAPGGTTLTDIMDDICLNENAGSGNSGSDDEVVVDDDEELVETKDHMDGPSGSDQNFMESGSSTEIEKMNIDSEAGPPFEFETSTGNTNPFGDIAAADWARFPEPSESEVGSRCLNPFLDSTTTKTVQPTSISSSVVDSILANGASTSPDLNTSSPQPADTSKTATPVPSLFEEDVEFLGVEPEGTEKAMEHALKEGIVGEAGPLKRSPTKVATASVEENADDDNAGGMKEFNDANYWRVDQEVAVLE
ncbi:LOW QUALITY PROTEIN: hypothetical protein V2J09_008974 [Rumex salicifolius]